LKKLILAVLLAFLSTGWALAAFITVTQPKSGDCLTYNVPFKLKYSPNLPSKYLQGKIILLQHNQLVGTIVSDIRLSDYVVSGWWWHDAGSYIGGHALVGSEYSIRVSTMDGAYWGDSGYFSIGAGNLISPKENDTWELGSTQTIRWWSFGFPAGEKVFLRLQPNGGGPDYYIQGGANLNLGSGPAEWVWTRAGKVLGAGNPIMVPPGKYYIVMQGPTANRIMGKPFTLSKPTHTRQSFVSLGAKPSDYISNFITVSKPFQGQMLKLGDILKIRWDKGQIPGYANVKLGVYRPDMKTYLCTVDGKTSDQKPNTGQFNTIALKTVFQAGQTYAIRVTTPDGQRFGFSGVFSIVQ